MSALARTTRTTFILMGGDVCHFGGSFRPTPYLPLPSPIPSSATLDPHFRTPCPCSIFTACHPLEAKNPNTNTPSVASRTTPFYRVSSVPGTYYADPPTAQNSIDVLAEFDADEDVWVCIAHDGGLGDVLADGGWYPCGNGANKWKERDWKERSRWGFLNELPVGGKAGRGRLVQGLVR